MEGTDDGVRVVDGDGPDVSELLDLHGALLELGIGHLDVELGGSRLDGVPSSQSRGEVHVSRHAEVGRVDNLIRGWVVEDSLGVDTGLVGEGAETSDGGVALSCQLENTWWAKRNSLQWDVDLDGLGNEILNILELVQLVLAHDIVPVGDNHACHETTQRGDTVSLTNSHNRGIDVSSAGLQSTVCVCDSASGIVVEMGLDITADNTTESSNQVVHLSGSSAADSVCDTDTVDANLVDGGVDREEVDQVRPEGVFTGESDFDVVRLDVVDNLNGRVGDVGHVLAVGVLHQVR